MIHGCYSDETPKTPVLPTDPSADPFYLFCNGTPLPVAVRAGVKEACLWRDSWAKHSSNEDKAWTLFHPTMKVWVGGAEDGPIAVQEAKEGWE